jgi:hypothetical protein
MPILDFSGDPEQIKAKVEQAIATYEMLGDRSPINFEEWFEQWEGGFLDSVENRTLGNYQLSGEKIWRSDTSKRPRWRQWSIKKGVITGEYWRDRSEESESIVLSGTTEQLIQHIIQIEYEGGGGEEVTRKGKKHLPPLVGQPEVFFHFQEDKPSVTNYKIRAEKSFRLMKVTDSPYNNDLNKISNSDLRNLANRILQNFYVGGIGIIWQKGRECVSYKGRVPRSQGMDSWHYCRSKQDGIELFDRLGAVAGVAIDRKFLRRTTVEDESGAFAATPQQAIVLGKPVEIPLQRPVCNVRFVRAEIYLPFSRQSIPLVVGGRNVAD